MNLDLISRDGAVDVLSRLCIGEARFKELNEVVANTRTLTKRLRELTSAGLIKRDGLRYKVTSKGFNIMLKIVELREEARHKLANREELAKIRYEWMKISLSRLVEIFLERFDDELISIVVYGSIVKGSFQIGKSDIDLLYILEDGTKDVWQREEMVFKDFQSTWEYKACDYQLKTLGAYGYPEVTTMSLMKSYAKMFQLVYLDMLFYRAVLYDKEGFFQGLMKKLKETLSTIGTIRIEYPDGTYGWFIKPDIAPGELLEIKLT